MVARENRGARFRSVIAFVGPGRGSGKEMELTFEGFWEGRITEARSGSGGFGYDPVFYIDSLGCTAAELSLERKGAVSHRGCAIKEFKQWLCGSGLLQV